MYSTRCTSDEACTANIISEATAAWLKRYSDCKSQLWENMVCMIQPPWGLNLPVATSSCPRASETISGHVGAAEATASGLDNNIIPRNVCDYCPLAGVVCIRCRGYSPSPGRSVRAGAADARRPRHRHLWRHHDGRWSWPWFHRQGKLRFSVTQSLRCSS